MQEVFEKIKERMEETTERYKRIRRNTICRRTEMDDCDSCKADHYLDARLGAISDTIEIVNQVAEEYDNDFCEWKSDFNWFSGKCKHETSCGYTFYDLKHAEPFKVCPYCGKKIKVVE